jgi:uncharacterized protein YndB with AHSA1/START domain
MADSIITADQDAVVCEIHVEAPPERVFAALTDSRQLLQWWGAEPSVTTRLWEIDPRPGGKWRMECTGCNGMSVNGVTEFEVHGEIIEFSPPRLLAYTWIANWHSDPSHTTVVTWDLRRVGNGTLVKVTHSGLANESVCRRDYSGGWPGVLDLLDKYLKG